MDLKTFRNKIFSRMLLGNCLGLAGVFLLCIIGAGIFLNQYTRHGEAVEIPDLTGQSSEMAIRKLQSLGLEGEVTDTGYVERLPAGAVLEQSIRPGEKVKPGRQLTLTINAAEPRKVALPDVADNCSRREAEDKLRVLGFKLGATEYIMGDPEWVYGIKVNGRSVPAGTKVSVTTPIVLVVGKGGEEYEYNGNDSLDYILNPSDEEEIIEGGEDVEAPQETPEAESERADDVMGL